MKRELVTIAIIVQSEEQDFQGTMESVLAQDYEKTELLVCAAKLSGNITLYLNRFVREDKRIRVIYLPGGSQTKLKNEAVKQAAGAYILFLNGNDWIDGDYVSTFMQRINRQEELTGVPVDIVQSGQMLLSGERFLRACFYEYDTYVEDDAIMEELVSLGYIGEQIWNKLIRIALLRKHTFDEKDVYYNIHMIYQLVHHAHAMLLISDYKYYVRVKQDIDILRRNQMKTNHDMDSLDERLERVEAYWTRYEEMREQYPHLQGCLLRSFLKEGLQILVIHPGNVQVCKKYADRLNALHGIVFQKKVIQEGLSLLNRKEQLLLQHSFWGKTIYRYIRDLEMKHPERYQRRNAQIDSFLEKMQQKNSAQNNKEEKQIRCTASKSGRIYLLGTPEYHNLGDHAIAYAEEQFVKKYLPEREIIMISEDHLMQNFDMLTDGIQREDILLLQGGGNMGSEYKEQEYIRSKVIAAFPHNHVIIMPQTIYFKKSKESQKLMDKMIQCYGQHRNLTLAAREEVSYSIMKSRFKKNKILLCPDIVMSLPYEKIAGTVVREDTREGVLLVLRSDTEGVLTITQLMNIKKLCIQYFGSVRMTETSISYAVTEEKREVELRKKWDEFLSARVVITDRLHGMIFAAITGTPCIVLTNYNHKLSGSYQWLESLHYIKYCNRVEFLQEILESMKREMFSTDLSVMPNIILKVYYEKLAEAIGEEKKHV